MRGLGDRIERLFAAWGTLAFTSLVFSSCFFVHMLTSMNNPFYFDLLAGSTIITAFLADLILAPPLMALVMRPRGVEVAAALEMEVSR